jgi:hypothetical protein
MNPESPRTLPVLAYEGTAIDTRESRLNETHPLVSPSGHNDAIEVRESCDRCRVTTVFFQIEEHPQDTQLLAKI